MTPRLLATGLLGSVLLSAGSWFAGALPGPAPASQAAALWGDGAGFRLGLVACLVGLGLLAGAWWRLGATVSGADPPRPAALLAAAALWAVPLLVAAPLGSRDLYAYACQGWLLLAGSDPYQLGAAAGGCPWVSAVPPLWQDSTAPYGPLALLGSAAATAPAVAVGPGGTGQLLLALAGLRLFALAGVVLLAGSLPALARACGVPPTAAAWLGLASPLVAVHGLAGGHNDALVAGLVVAALALAASRRLAVPAGSAAVAAGLLAGLAVAVKVTALVALPFVLVLLAGRGRWRLAVPAGSAAVAGFAGVTLAAGLGFGWLAALRDTGALVQWSTVPTGLGMAAGYLLRLAGWPGGYDSAVAGFRVAGVLLLVGVAAVTLWRGWRRRVDPAAVVTSAGIVLAAVVLLAPVAYPWYALTPLAVLAAVVRSARLRWWLAVATLIITGLALPSGLGIPVLTKLPGALLMAAWVGWLSWWWLRRRSGAASGSTSSRPGRSGPSLPGLSELPEPGRAESDRC